MSKWRTTNYIEVYTFFFLVDRIKGALVHVVIVLTHLNPILIWRATAQAIMGLGTTQTSYLEWYIEVFTR